MKIAYTEFGFEDDSGLSIWRPRLRVSRHGPAGSATLDMLVDSGSDETQVPLSLIETLGIPLSNERVLLQGMGGHLLEGRVAGALFTFRDQHFESRLVAAAGPDQHYFLLGHRDFFAQFWVAFDDSRREFLISPHTRRATPH